MEGTVGPDILSAICPRAGGGPWVLVLSREYSGFRVWGLACRVSREHGNITPQIPYIMYSRIPY